MDDLQGRRPPPMVWQATQVVLKMASPACPDTRPGVAPTRSVAMTAPESST